MPVGLGLGRDHEPHYGRREGMVLMPYDPLWVGQLAGLRGRTVEPAAGPRGTRCMKGSIPLGGSPRLPRVTYRKEKQTEKWDLRSRSLEYEMEEKHNCYLMNETPN